MSTQLEDIVRLLEQSPDFKVLRRLQPRDVFSQSHCEQPLVGVALDTETTCLDLDKAEVIELAMLKFLYTRNGEVLRVIGKFDELRQPAHPIPPEITALTGITDDWGIHLTGVRDLPPRAARRRSLQAGRMSALSRCRFPRRFDPGFPLRTDPG